MEERDLMKEFEAWKKFHKYLALEKKGYEFSKEEYEEIFILLKDLILRKGQIIEDCVKKNGIQHILIHPIIKEPC